MNSGKAPNCPECTAFRRVAREARDAGDYGKETDCFALLARHQAMAHKTARRKGS
ncbi:hypothetical protein K2224_02595 [Streptomyces sp. BHT-5-2]|uniref:hypothetical protein n=1 Tax=unclassified Streptomyces TaxID=2593676 RepID=UPI001C8D3CB1|nr:hypothetical protein [Streptomyces sp. BHT-5-2]QZL02242.1 hypothetical protein K2224_02595 [Streptomyces sp. BHT-5-2]